MTIVAGRLRPSELTNVVARRPSSSELTRGNSQCRVVSRNVKPDHRFPAPIRLNEIKPVMSEVICRPVENRRDQKAFLELERRLYHDDPNWVPPLWSERKKLVGFKPHPFWLDAEGQTFLVRRDDKVIGRLLACVNHAHNRAHKDQVGFFGFFECENDPEAARVLLDTACDWLRQRDMTIARGPIHPSLNYEVGLLVDGFDTPPTFLITYNHPYYESLIKGAGFKKIQDVFSYEASIDILNDLDPKLMFIIEEAQKRFKTSTRRIPPLALQRGRTDFPGDLQQIAPANLGLRSNERSRSGRAKCRLEAALDPRTDQHR